MLIGIPSLLPPDLMKIMMEMGHGDEIVLGDSNFPAASIATRLVRCDGISGPQLLTAILKLYPLDQYVEHPVTLMQVVPGDPVKTTIWDNYKTIISTYTTKADPFEWIDRFDFYERAKQAYAVVATGETAQYANVILKKGVITATE